MFIRKLCMALSFVGLGWIVSCGSDSSSGSSSTPLGGGVGSPCSADSQCTGYSKPSCVTEIKPLADLVDGGSPKFKNFTLPFPGGYCSNTIQDSCASDADCGAGAGCFLAFEGVSQTTIDGLAALGLPFDVRQFATLGICLKKCTADTECRSSEGYHCLVPLKGFMDVINSAYTKTFCIQNVDTSGLLQ